MDLVDFLDLVDRHSRNTQYLQYLFVQHEINEHLSGAKKELCYILFLRFMVFYIDMNSIIYFCILNLQCTNPM